MFNNSTLFKILFYTSIIFMGILFIPSLLSKRSTRLTVRIWSQLIIFLLQRIIGVEITFENKFLNKNQGYLLAANHQSIFETIFFLKEFDKVVYIIKKELKLIPIYGWYASRLGNIFLDRKKRISSVKTLSKEIGSLIKKGYKIIIFPEGTRQKANTIGQIKPGLYAMLKEIENSVHPIYINSGSTWPKSGKIRKNDIMVKVLPSVKKTYEKREFLNTIRDLLIKENEKYKKLK